MSKTEATFYAVGEGQADQSTGGRDSWLQSTEDFGPLKVLVNLPKIIHSRHISQCLHCGGLWESGRGHDPILVVKASSHVKK